MKNYQHKSLAEGRWFAFTLAEQMANIGSEISRIINWRAKGNQVYSQSAFERALELIDLTVADKKNRTYSKLKEILRLREAMVDYFWGRNEYNFDDKFWNNYFDKFNLLARL